MFKDTLHHLNLRELSELAGNDVVEALDAVGVTEKNQLDRCDHFNIWPKCLI